MASPEPPRAEAHRHESLLLGAIACCLALSIMLILTLIQGEFRDATRFLLQFLFPYIVLFVAVTIPRFRSSGLAACVTWSCISFIVTMWFVLLFLWALGLTLDQGPSDSPGRIKEDLVPVCSFAVLQVILFVLSGRLTSRDHTPSYAVRMISGFAPFVYVLILWWWAAR